MKTFAPNSTTYPPHAATQHKRLPSRHELTAEASASLDSTLFDHRPQAMADQRLQGQTPLQAKVDNSPRQVAQRQQLEQLFGPPAQRQVELDEEELQMQAAPGTLQRQSLEDEELLQGKMESVQRQEDPEEEELLQGKFGPVQRQSLEDEELLQGKMAPAQRQEDLEEEELLQGQFDPIQRQGLEDEELVQGKFAISETSSQRQGSEDPAENPTGVPDSLKGGLEQLSGMDLSGVLVHHNSAKPAQMNASGYEQGQNIHLGLGQERHLPHEGWHAVQQMQGRVKPMMRLQGVSIYGDKGLKNKADLMRAKAMQMSRPDRGEFNVPTHLYSNRALGAYGTVAALTSPISAASIVIQRELLKKGSPVEFWTNWGMKHCQAWREKVNEVANTEQSGAVWNVYKAMKSFVEKTNNEKEKKTTKEQMEWLKKAHLNLLKLPKTSKKKSAKGQLQLDDPELKVGPLSYREAKKKLQAVADKKGKGKAKKKASEILDEMNKLEASEDGLAIAKKSDAWFYCMREFSMVSKEELPSEQQMEYEKLVKEKKMLAKEQKKKHQTKLAKQKETTGEAILQKLKIAKKVTDIGNVECGGKSNKYHLTLPQFDDVMLLSSGMVVTSAFKDLHFTVEFYDKDNDNNPRYWIMKQQWTREKGTTNKGARKEIQDKGEELHQLIFNLGIPE